VKTHVISERLKVTPAAVSDMLKKLSEKKFISYKPYQGVLLTKTGTAYGRTMVRRHRILEMYLHQKLGFQWDEVHKEAEQLEHAASEKLINKMDEDLGFPKFDPHGDPIPDMNGKMPVSKDLVFLSEAKAGRIYEVVRVSDFDGDFLHFLDDMGLKLHTKIEVNERRSFDQSLLVDVNNVQQTISFYATRHIRVREVKKNEK
jgi:DtxR family Mn-dependent transcriptional regulator